jgi:hypothetical protein
MDYEAILQKQKDTLNQNNKSFNEFAVDAQALVNLFPQVSSPNAPADATEFLHRLCDRIGQSALEIKGIIPLKNEANENSLM